jgi:hypothetical protein
VAAGVQKLPFEPLVTTAKPTRKAGAKKISVKKSAKKAKRK